MLLWGDLSLAEDEAARLIDAANLAELLAEAEQAEALAEAEKVETRLAEAEQAEALAEAENADAEAARTLLPHGRAVVYYNTAWLAPRMVARALTAVPAVHSRRDTLTVMANGRVLGPYHPLPSELLNCGERVRARHKVIAAWLKCHATGGSGPFPHASLPVPFDLLVAHTASVDWDQPHQDAADFFVLPAASERLRRIAAGRHEVQPLHADLGEPVRWYLDVPAWRAAVAEDVALVLKALDAEGEASGRRLHVKLPPLGLGARMRLWDGTPIDTALLFSTFLAGVADALASKDWPWIAVLELVDISADGAFTPTAWPAVVRGVAIVTGLARDVLDFGGIAATLAPALVLPGDVFAWPGNRTPYPSLNSTVGYNTDLCAIACFAQNQALLCEDAWRGVDVAVAGPASSWWPPPEWRLARGS